MPDRNPNLLAAEIRHRWVRLRTLILLRWVAIAGQLAAIAVGQYVFDLRLELGLCLLVVGASVIANLVMIFVYPENKRLREAEVAGMLLFDIAQLSGLLFLTGGLHNPFALLILAPVTISATALSLRATILLGAAAIALISLVGWAHVPLRTDQGFIMRMPQVFLFGMWVAITTGIVFMALYARRVTSEIHSMSEALLATQMALAREQKLTDLGGVVAAAAHELGTPLATIKLVSREMAEELTDTELREDAELIGQQADRCRDILRSMGRAGKDDLHMRHAPLGEVIREAAEPHKDRGKALVVDVAPGDGGDTAQPLIARRPEIIHGLRNLIQNAVDFAATTVWIDALWTDREIELRIIDDGRGFPPHLLGRIGDPFVRKRNSDADREERPEYEGMGLGLFIAKTLLERSGAELSFANGRDPLVPQTGEGTRTGAIVELVWPRDAIAAPDDQRAGGLGENQPILG
ncbi:ActS/PrrB/RegB family redox-sensitive histidine kinase [Psychromarinibacter sp. C21-152]|uniref:histidine kinase n=1 Tax=Psychromarinibacter sediminicola TaxID=3033385 RepID=A0AAE3NUI7_9RHOB|nr:ActS/PrrB/RegB family redox-sensitive histidine kinase [Psychromarinibacter sediminicola]MDF0602336.1 ActS/PrrB/RegB family redox-sensitive histidine kinase [Psychromarinibacter sediminicola]